MATLKLNKSDLSSECWIKIRQFLEAELQDLRERNDASLDAEKTADIRGQIKQVKAMLKAQTPATEIRPVAFSPSA